MVWSVVCLGGKLGIRERFCLRDTMRDNGRAPGGSRQIYDYGSDDLTGVLGGNNYVGTYAAATNSVEAVSIASARFFVRAVSTVCIRTLGL
jgi:hypothetical protein